MNAFTAAQIRHAGRTTLLVGSLLMLAACASTPSSPTGAAEARNELSALQADRNLAQHAAIEIREAEAAVSIAEQPLSRDDARLGQHRVYMAERKVALARAKATGRYASEQRNALVEERDQARLEARSREAASARADAGRARDDATIARSDASRAQDQASSARYAEIQAMAEADAARRTASSAQRSEAEASAGAEASRREAEAARSSETRATAAAESARQDAQSARRSEAQTRAQAEAQTAEMQRQINALQAKTTERGLVLTLGDLLFATDHAVLEAGAHRHLDRLVGFLESYPERRVAIEGHTDNVGSPDYNLGLSRRRAESVMAYLTEHGIDSARLTAKGLGQEQPIGSNQTAPGRQQNRRVEIIIEDPRETLASD